MSNVALTIHGLDELREQLKKLPAELAAKAAPIVHGHADRMARDVSAAYPTGPTGNLKQHLQVTHRGDGVSAGAQVKNTARHAYLFEKGSRKRAWKNGKNTGTMPAANLFVPIAIAHRQAMYAELIQLVEQAGLDVTGSTV